MISLLLAASLLLTACQPTGGDALNADGITVVSAQRIVTLDEAAPEVTALAFDDEGVIVALGETATLLDAYDGAEHVDLGEVSLIPGLIDAHGHLLNLGMTRLQADLVGAASLDETLQRLQQHEASLPAGAWLLGRGWDQNDWPEKGFPTRQDLDALFPERPVWLRRIDGHAGWANSVALATISEDLSGDWQPEGGYIQRDEMDQPSGILVDSAMAMIDQQVPPPSAELVDQALDLALAETARYGLTGVHDAGTAWPVLQRYLQREREGRLPLRIYAMADGASETFDRLCEAGPLGSPNGRVYARSVKLYADGALGSRGAALIKPYSDAPGTRGLLFHADQALTELVTKAMGCGLQLNTHAIGDDANRQVLSAYDQAMESVPGHPGRHRIEHAQIIRIADIARLRQLGLIASMQPTHATSDMPWAEDRVGPQRILGGYAWRRFLSARVPLALGSDFPVESANPLLGIYAAVSRQDLEGQPAGGWYPEQRLQIEEALRGFTLDAAYAAYMEDAVGSLSVGKRADFVALDRDLLATPVAEIPAIQVVSTWLDGEQIYPELQARED